MLCLIGKDEKNRLEHHRAKEAGVKVDEAEGKRDESKRGFLHAPSEIRLCLIFVGKGRRKQYGIY